MFGTAGANYSSIKYVKENTLPNYIIFFTSKKSFQK
jgi:hypothetical protein